MKKIGIGRPSFPEIVGAAFSAFLQERGLGVEAMKELLLHCDIVLYLAFDTLEV